MPRNRSIPDQDVIQAAVQVFWQRGFDAASMRDLAKATRLDVKSLSQRYGNKQALFLRCLEAYVSLAKQSFAKATATPGVAAAMAVFRNIPADGCLVAKTAPLSGVEDPDVRALVLDYRAFIEGRFEECASVENSADPKATATVLRLLLDARLNEPAISSERQDHVEKILTELLTSARCTASRTPASISR